MTQAHESMTPEETRGWLLDISRDTHALMTLALQGQETRTVMLRFTAAQPEARRAEYIARVTHDLAAIAAEQLVSRCNGDRAAALQAHQQAVIQLEALEPRMRLLTRPTTGETEEDQP